MAGLFEIQTDPKNTRYVVVSGARQKDEDWDPEENGRFAIHGADTEGKAGLADPRPEALQGVSDHYGNDPYALSSLVRKRFRVEKKIEAQKRAEDDTLKGKYGLPEDLKLIENDAEASTRRGMNGRGLEQ
ncbi:hypothetical protein K503DRAFT_777766 [Rhizopogon vinicolor AM-OR11-026]|uniref:Uncharacterized protein n=1 Tax=Rhizopogon vinicolor AM-OR11-026 TaxID=1314800 RepID=A0A1B7MF45_9AGAM|nr:hypothetical protein K503DRAFT_777766 [Rhizopogon vinicolor AM-OR11-026]